MSAPRGSGTHLVLIPTYNTGPLVLRTVRAARAVWTPVWVVVDGSTDGTGALLEAEARADPGLRVLVLPVNRGKGSALLVGARAALEAGFTHALTCDADGQHPIERIADFMDASMAAPGAMVLGVPIFGPEAPAIRVGGRKLSNWWARREAGQPIGDSLFGFRVYPIAPLLAVMSRTAWMRRFDFDPEAVVRMCWLGVPVINRPAPVVYLSPEAGGVSHFNYWRDNTLLTWMHLRLVLAATGRRILGVRSR